jgi:hypothetical protein
VGEGDSRNNQDSGNQKAGRSNQLSTSFARSSSCLIVPSEVPTRDQHVAWLACPLQILISRNRKLENSKSIWTVYQAYHETLKGTPEALKYLETRGLKSLGMIEHFRMGFATRTENG